MRLSYVILQEVVSPSIVVELLSPGTEQEDLGQTQTEDQQPQSKWQDYEQILQVPLLNPFWLPLKPKKQRAKRAYMFSVPCETPSNSLLVSYPLRKSMWKH
jgi:Uma2 family endonuclease